MYGSKYIYHKMITSLSIAAAVVAAAAASSAAVVVARTEDKTGVYTKKL